MKGGQLEPGIQRWMIVTDMHLSGRPRTSLKTAESQSFFSDEAGNKNVIVNDGWNKEKAPRWQQNGGVEVVLM